MDLNVNQPFSKVPPGGGTSDYEMQPFAHRFVLLKEMSNSLYNNMAKAKYQYLSDCAAAEKKMYDEFIRCIELEVPKMGAH